MVAPLEPKSLGQTGTGLAPQTAYEAGGMDNYPAAPLEAQIRRPPAEMPGDE
jgi:hypothetical protein